ncbi:hypothetical protein QE152_g26310 [Popillia japonica]|uniref:Uncharacterized protein n=1 Tax=Popillia japonica TaxID=7064 RepID=A0AAW1JYA5_POPJA
MGRKVYNYSGANWLSFRSLMNGIQLVSDIPDIATLDRMVREYTDNIRKVANKTISLKTINPFRYNELPAYVAELIKGRNRLRKQFQRTRDQDVRREANTLTSCIRKTILKHRNDTYNDRLTQAMDLYGS